MGLFLTTSEGKRATVRSMAQAAGLMALVLAATASTASAESAGNDAATSLDVGAVRITKRSRKIPTLLIFRPRPPPTRHSLQRESNEVWVC